MKAPRRIELWLLFAVIAAGLIFVFASRHRDDEDAGGAPPAPADDPPIVLHRCVIERDRGNARLDIELRLRNDRSEMLVLQPPKARLLAASGRDIPAFFLPFEELPEVPPKTTRDVQLRYWLEAADLQGALKLEVDRGTVDVKSAKPFDLETLKNGDRKTFGAGEW